MVPKRLLDIARRNESIRRFARKYQLYNKYETVFENIPKRLFKYNLGYDENYYLKQDNTYQDGIIHNAMLSAALYAVGYDRYEEHVPILKKIQNQHYTVQTSAIKQVIKKTPKYVIDVGGGRGELAVLLQECGIYVTVIDPSKGSASIIHETSKRLGGGGRNRSHSMYRI